MNVIDRMSDDAAYDAYKAVRFAKNGGDPFCPRCGCTAVYQLKCRRAFTCQGCVRQFSVTTGTAFADHKLTFYQIMKATAHFVLCAQGKSAIELSHLLGIGHRSAFKLLQKIRCAMKLDAQSAPLTGEVEIDGAVFGGVIRPTNVMKKKTDLRKFPYRSDEKEFVVVVRQRNGAILTTVAKHETEAKPFIRDSVVRGTRMYADSGAWWNNLRLKFDLKRVNHKREWVRPDAHTNNAESYFSILRRAEMGTYHHISGIHLSLYAAEIAWRQQRNKTDDLTKYSDLHQALAQPIAVAPKRNRNGLTKARREARKALQATESQ